MAPSATTEEVQFPLQTSSKVGVAPEPEKHAHGGEGKTPLEAISQGPLIQPGEILKVLVPSFLSLQYGWA